MRLALLALVAALSFTAGAAAAQTSDAETYALDVSVFRDGVQVVGAHSLIKVDGTSEISINDGDEALLALSLNIVDGEGNAQQPQIMMRKTGEARIEIGQTDTTGMIDGLSVTLKRAPAARTGTR